MPEDSMAETLATLQRKIRSAEELRSVVRTMKILAASNTRQYDRSVRALAIYYRAVELGLSVCFRRFGPELSEPAGGSMAAVAAVVFGSDQGLVGRFNDVIAGYAVSRMPADRNRSVVWAVGERVCECLSQSGVTPAGVFAVPNAVGGITPLIGQILTDAEAEGLLADGVELRLFYNRPCAGTQHAAFEQRLLPLDRNWQKELSRLPWPTGNLPVTVGDGDMTLQALIREYVFVSLFRACAESLASENASRLAAMQRADRNIEELLESLKRSFHELRQNEIDAELFDLVSGFEALVGKDV